MKLGHIIKTARIQQEMKQIVLAKGICTPSYLSRIEQGITTPSDEIISLLLKKLGIDSSRIKKNTSKALIEYEALLENSYKEVLINWDKNFTQEKLNNLEEQNLLLENHLLHSTYLLIKLRYHLILGKDVQVLKKELETIKEMSKDFSPRHTYLFYMNKALYYYLIKNRKKSIEFFEAALFTADKITLEEWEKADLNYMLGLAYIADNRIFNSIEYIRKALDYFRDNFLMKRVLDCYILIGITYKESDQFPEALDSYLKAKKICEEFGLQDRLGIVYHNLGSLNIVMGNNVEGINYYHKSLEYKIDKKSRLISLLGLIIEYSKNNNDKLVIDWTDKGILLYSQINDESLKSYYYHFQFYKSLHGKHALSQDISTEIIEYFVKLQDYRHAQKYSIALAESLFNQGKYKLASSFFKEANNYFYINKNIRKWEEL